jgi:hypothetical protein
MIAVLSWLSTLLNLAGLAVSLCLGFYLVTRTPRSRVAWLAALMLWVLSGFFLHNILVVNLPASGVLPFLRPMVVFALPLGFHLILLLPPGAEPQPSDFYQPALRLPGTVQRWLGSLSQPISRVVVPLAYTLALALALGGVFPFGHPPKDASAAAIYLSDLVPGPLYPLSIAYLVLLGALALAHLWQGWRQAPGARQKRRYTPLFAAIVLTGLGGLTLGLGVWLRWDVPGVAGDVALGLAALTLGYTVARHNARVEGRDIKRDLRYVALAIGSFTIFYLIVAEILYLGGHIFSTLTLILIVVVAVSTLMLYDGLRATLDRLFYRQQFRQLRANLRALSREASIGQALPDRLQAILGALCRTLRIRRGMIALRQGDAFVCQATDGAHPVGEAFPLPILAASETLELSQPGTVGLEDMALLVPLYDGDAQIGALVLSFRESGQGYSEEDLLLVEDLADQLAAMIQTMQLQEENARLLSDMVADFREQEQALQRQVQAMLAEPEEEARPTVGGLDEGESVGLVEDALRRLHDYSYLGEHALVRLQVVDRSLAQQNGSFVTHIERGKALSGVLVQALSRLRPEGTEPSRQTIPSREWHPFIVLHDAYVLGELNRDIMNRLYVGEGTFNRTRRRALRSVAKALQEMEQQAQSRP